MACYHLVTQMKEKKKGKGSSKEKRRRDGVVEGGGHEARR